MKKILLIALSLITIIACCSCASNDNLTTTSALNNSTEKHSNSGSSMVTTALFTNIKALVDKGLPESTESHPNASHYIYCDDIEATFKSYYDDFHSEQFELTHKGVIYPDHYVPISEAVENLELTTPLKLGVIGNQEDGTMISYRFYDKKGTENLILTYYPKSCDPGRYDGYPIEFDEKELSEKAVNEFSLPSGEEENTVNFIDNAYVVFYNDKHSSEIYSIHLHIDGWLYEVRPCTEYVSFKNEFCNEKVITELIKNIRDVKLSKTTSYDE